VKSLVFFWIASLVGCGSSNGLNRTIAKLPLYSECHKEIVEYKEQLETKYPNYSELPSIDIELFTESSEAHHEIIGMIVFSQNKDISQLMPFETLVNGIKDICFPQAKFSTEIGLNTLEHVLNKIRSNERQGIEENYLSLSDNSINVYYNDRKVRGLERPSLINEKQ